MGAGLHYRSCKKVIRYHEPGPKCWLIGLEKLKKCVRCHAGRRRLDDRGSNPPRYLISLWREDLIITTIYNPGPRLTNNDLSDRQQQHKYGPHLKKQSSSSPIEHVKWLLKGIDGANTLCKRSSKRWRHTGFQMEAIPWSWTCMGTGEKWSSWLDSCEYVHETSYIFARGGGWYRSEVWGNWRFMRFCGYFVYGR